MREKKEYLRNFTKLENLKNIYNDEILALKTRAEKITSNSEKVGGSSAALKDDAYVSLIERKEKYQIEIKKIKAQQIEIENKINNLSIADERTVLFLRYIKNYSWIKIMRIMHTSERSIYRIHERALNNISI